MWAGLSPGSTELHRVARQAPGRHTRSWGPEKGTLTVLLDDRCTKGGSQRRSAPAILHRCLLLQLRLELVFAPLRGHSGTGRAHRYRGAQEECKGPPVSRS